MCRTFYAQSAIVFVDTIRAKISFNVECHCIIIEYILPSSGGENRFEVDPESGVVRTRGNQPFVLDKEYEIGVSSQDVAATTPQRSPTQSLKILVGERDPQFFETQYIASVPEDAQTQYKLVVLLSIRVCFRCLVSM